MNIVGHIIIGSIQSIAMGNPMPLLGNIIPDVALIPNELSNRIKGKHFNEHEVNEYAYKFYMLLHSLLFAMLFITIDYGLFVGIVSHQIVDWITHTNRFRTMPLYPLFKGQIGLRVNDKKCLLLSGGYDSVAILEMINRKEYDFYFFDYGQSYNKQEQEAIVSLSKYYGIEINQLNMNWGTDIRNRNFLMISRMQELGYQTICIGSRNVLPMFDKYKDSNYVILKLYAFVNRIVIETPVAFMTKKQIVNKIPKDLINHLYSTEIC
jgi:7-cyano-7-deazaguanine synthase in queuosine biosynthesis